ncbi:Lrp/AsnC family transcriptional regulator [Alteromonas sediminis]|uniref:Lrp/AsnC family transcriptional regulator n=1 Tax=Alteromonas sediminis TaxID=2259342 RepID=A0A3N5Y4Z7_9ALTE|nr:Lrp/AsnC family transcriptional regulator [Alteromonas sediminis]RPJ68026.1 Lrp/AsnC family transcriptional regulator [Alteromonas sediminis]
MLDKLDKEILRLLQVDAGQSVSDIAEQVGLTQTPCWRRIQVLEQKGVIQSRVALLDPNKLNVGLTVFVQVKALKHDDKWLAQFAAHTQALEQVTEIHRMSGEYDYLLKVMVADMASFDHFYKKLVAGIELSDVTSSFSMEKIKYTSALPLNHI